MHVAWNSLYLVCFGVGLVLALLAVLTGLGHLQIDGYPLHLHVSRQSQPGSGDSHLQAETPDIAQVSPLNGFSLVAFLCWFGGTGYLLHHANVFSALVVLLFSVLSGLAGAALVFWFLAKVLLRRERTLQPPDTEMTGVIGRLSAQVPAGGFGELLYSQNGARRSASVRSDNGQPIERGVEVVVMRHERGIAYVRRWDDFEHGLMGGEAARHSEP